MVQLKPVEGDQTKLPAPLPSKVVLLPEQMLASVPALADGVAGVVMVTSSEEVPQPLVTVRV